MIQWQQTVGHAARANEQEITLQLLPRLDRWVRALDVRAHGERLHHWTDGCTRPWCSGCRSNRLGYSAVIGSAVDQCLGVGCVLGLNALRPNIPAVGLAVPSLQGANASG